ncbi:MAG: hypothetical protein OSB09_04315 [Planctomycetota bacterium]|nr:hypothetical protein [Planctomycetota bacterium]
MEGGPLLSDWWVDESKKFVAYLNISAQLEDKPDQKLMREYDLRGFPSFVFLDDSGLLLFGKEPYWRPDSALALGQGLAQVGELFELRKLVQQNPGDEIARARLTLIEGLLDPSRADLEKMDAAVKIAGVPEELVEEWAMTRIEAKFLSIFEPYRSAFQKKSADRDAKKTAAIEGCYRMWVAGEKLASSSNTFRPFLVLTFDGALLAEDAKVAGNCLAMYETLFGSHDRFLKGMKTRLEKMVISTGKVEVGSIGGGRE